MLQVFEPVQVQGAQFGLSHAVVANRKFRPNPRAKERLEHVLVPAAKLQTLTIGEGSSWGEIVLIHPAELDRNRWLRRQAA